MRPRSSTAGRPSNPSAGELLEAARLAGRHSFLLPKDSNVLLAAELAAEQAPGSITVIPARTTPAGLSAALGYQREGDPERVRAQMEAQLADVHSIEVTRAVRETSIDGIVIALGDANRAGRRAPRRSRRFAGGVRCFRALAPLAADASLVTIYLGVDANAASAATVERLIGEAHADLEVEILPGGQPHYPYLASIE